MSDKQAVVEDPNIEAKPSTEGDNAQDDLDSLLNEYDQQAKPKQTQTVTEPKSEQNEDIAFLRQYVEEQRQEQAKKATRSSIDGAVTKMKSGLSQSLPDAIVEGYLYREVENDPRALALWQNREQAPSDWGKFVDAVAKKLDREMTSMPDKKLSEDRDVVTSAVHSASKHSPQESSVDWAHLSQADFETEKMKLLHPKS